MPGEGQKFGRHFAAAVARGRKSGGSGGRGVGSGSGGKMAGSSQSGKRAGRSVIDSSGGRAVEAGGDSSDDEGDRSGKGKGVKLRMARRLLPSASQVQRGCESPGVEAMAEAFLRGDVAGEVVGEEGEGGDDIVVEGGEEGEDGAASEGGIEDGEGDGHEGGEEAEVEDVEEEEALEEPAMPDVVLGGVEDEVSAVMENLDDFLGGHWDLDAELAKARRAEGGGSGSGYGMGGSDGFGLMDVGVWD